MQNTKVLIFSKVSTKGHKNKFLKKILEQNFLMPSSIVAEESYSFTIADVAKQEQNPWNVNLI